MFSKLRRLYIDEKDIATVLTTIHTYRKWCWNYDIGNCGWFEEPSTWFVGFRATNRQWAKIYTSLSEIGKVEAKLGPKGLQTFIYFKRKGS